MSTTKSVLNGLKILKAKAFGPAQVPTQSRVDRQNSIQLPPHTDYLGQIESQSSDNRTPRAQSSDQSSFSPVKVRARLRRGVVSAQHGASELGQVGQHMGGATIDTAKSAGLMAKSAATVVAQSGVTAGRLSALLVNKAIAKNIRLQGIPYTRQVDPTQKLTIVLHGTTEKQETGSKTTLTSQLVADAAKMKNNRVIVIDGISSRTSKKNIAAVQQEYPKEKVTYLPSNVNKYAGPLGQFATGNGMFLNAANVIEQVSKLDPMPGQIEICGFSRGGVTATLTAALLDEITSTMAPDQRSQIKLNIVCLDPVPGPTKQAKALYSRDILKDITLDAKVTVINAGLDPMRGVLNPQPGKSSNLEELVIMPTSHTGVNGYDKGDAINLDIKTVSQFIAQTKLNITNGDHKPSVDSALRSNINIVKNQQELASQKNFVHRQEGKSLTQSAENIFLDSSIKDAFDAKFPELEDTIGLLLSQSLGEFSLVDQHDLVSEIKSHTLTLPKMEDRILLEDYTQILQVLLADRNAESDSPSKSL